MVREYMVEGQNNRLFYAEKNLDRRDDIFMLYLGKKSSKAKKRKIFELGCEMIGIETDNNNDMI